MPYRLNPETGRIDYDALQQLASVYRPKLLVSGASAYSRDFDYARLREVHFSAASSLKGPSLSDQTLFNRLLMNTKPICFMIWLM